MDKDTVISRIQKLLALSKSDNQHEAELAASKASKLMEEYQIGLSDVEIKDSFSRGNIVEEYYTVDGQKMKLLWIETLAFGCAKAFDATVLVNNRLHGTGFRFVGFREDIDAAKALFEHCYMSWFGIVERDLAAAKKWAMEYDHYRYRPKDTMKFKQGHGVGYANIIFNRCVALAAERKSNVQTATGTSLVVVKDDALREYGEAKGWGTSRKTCSVGTADGRAAGMKAGASIHLGRSIDITRKLGAA